MKALRALTDLRPTPAAIECEVLAGLARNPKRLPSKYFYDARGSELFEAITLQPEYYLTRIELALLESCLTEISIAVGPCAHVVEYGSGSGRKTDLLLDALENPVAYTPIEISRTALLQCVAVLGTQHPKIEMLPVCADFTHAVQLPHAARLPARTLVFFPGSTLGNFEAAEAVQLLRAMRETMGEGGAALVGIDLVKPAPIIDAAYNDAAGITAEFTLNLLTRLNREIGSDFDLAAFEHCAEYVVARSRIETYLLSQRAQTVRIGESQRAFAFADGEAILVEISHKYTDDCFESLAASAGLAVINAWNDPTDGFGLRLITRRL